MKTPGVYIIIRISNFAGGPWWLITDGERDVGGRKLNFNFRFLFEKQRQIGFD